MRMSAFHVRRSRIDHIFISHLHGDHYFGLIGLLTSYHLMGRTNQITIYAPEPLEAIISAQLSASNTTLKYPLHFHHTSGNARQLICETENVEIWSFPLLHRIPTTGFLFVEKQTDRRIVKEKVQGLKLTHQQYLDLKNGLDIQLEDGTTIANDELTYAPHKPRTYAFCSDTMYYPDIKAHIDGVDLLYHEATFLREDAQRAAETYHSTTDEAANIAKHVGAHQLLIGHFSSKYPDLSVYLDECKAVFTGSLIAIEGNTYEVTRQHSIEIVEPPARKKRTA
jgi:ribonuclease Z